MSFICFSIIAVVVVSILLIFCSEWLPNWLCDYTGHLKPKHVAKLKDSDSVVVGKCSRCGKLVQNDTDYPSDVWY